MDDAQAYEETYRIQGGDFQQAGKASGAIKRLLKELGLPTELIRRASVAVYEAEMNVVVHAYTGTMTLRIDDEKITIVVADKGPGIEDVGLAMTEGYSTASPQVREMGFGAGMGLPNIKKNVDEMMIDTNVGKGTTLTMVVRL